MANQPGLSDSEREVLKVLWDRGPGTVRAINAELARRGRRWAYTTVATLLQRLAAKQYVASDPSAVPHVYRAVGLARRAAGAPAPGRGRRALRRPRGPARPGPGAGRAVLARGAGAAAADDRRGRGRSDRADGRNHENKPKPQTVIRRVIVLLILTTDHIPGGRCADAGMVRGDDAGGVGPGRGRGPGGPGASDRPDGPARPVAGGAGQADDPAPGLLALGGALARPGLADPVAAGSEPVRDARPRPRPRRIGPPSPMAVPRALGVRGQRRPGRKSRRHPLTRHRRPWPATSGVSGAAVERGLLVAWLVVTGLLGAGQAWRILRFRRRLRLAVPAPDDLVAEAERIAGAVRRPGARAAGRPRAWARRCSGAWAGPSSCSRAAGQDPRPATDGAASWPTSWPTSAAATTGSAGSSWLAGLLWWWNPLYWLTRARLDAEAELACDAWVVWALPKDRLAYAETLFDIGSALSRAGSPAPALGVAGSGRFLERRLTMILHERVPCRLSPLALLAVAPPGPLRPALLVGDRRPGRSSPPRDRLPAPCRCRRRSDPDPSARHRRR